MPKFSAPRSLRLVDLPAEHRRMFRQVRSTVIRGSTLDVRLLRAALRSYRRALTSVVVKSDAELHKLMLQVVFYSGMHADTVTQRMPRIEFYLGDLKTAAAMKASGITIAMADPEMLRNERKIRACVRNAKKITAMAERHGSLATWMNSFGPLTDDKNLKHLRRALIKEFSFIGETTVYHVLMELGLNVVKPDRVLQRVFYRMGLTSKPVERRTAAERRDYLWEVVLAARILADRARVNLRELDITFMAFGQLKVATLGIVGICVEDTPRCDDCQVLQCPSKGKKWWPKTPSGTCRSGDRCR